MSIFVWSTVNPQISFLFCGYNTFDAYMHAEHYAEHSKQRERKRGGRKKFLQKVYSAKQKEYG